ncbi:RNase H domain-containing protein [Nephila pilipes]|uniref:RNase H domain-containing protein n=1 Tax=Nephila pilipes TaxID=299642 RepID=A0A8X6NSU9_NEPPI|nr:RNase H domain-containing protein [Nephila pilipes]
MSVFRSKLIAIDSALSKTLSFPNSSSIWILTNSRCAILYFSNRHRVGDNTGFGFWIHLQWISSHVNNAGKDIADTLAKYGAVQHPNPLDPLTYAELQFTYNSNKW